ncbi:dynein light chain type 2, putative [Hepatocystis sp. ex Piliocolobus tephrosceles]|nr:dynein light chain type 2, putative [Hepatocystis sp. ex Piliocolobus tephrosceles]
MDSENKNSSQNVATQESENNNKDENKVNMQGFCFFADTCEKKLNIFLENFFNNKKNEELKYIEENIEAQKLGNNVNNNIAFITNKNSMKNVDVNYDYQNDYTNYEDDNSSDGTEKNYFERQNLVKSNFDKIALNLVDEVEQFMKSFVNDRYKIVIQGVIGENKRQGIHIASKSLWNVETDNYVSAKYVNDLIFVTIMVFLIYNE